MAVTSTYVIILIASAFVMFVLGWLAGFACGFEDGRREEQMATDAGLDLMDRLEEPSP